MLTDISWTGGAGSTDFGEESNWNLEKVPTAGDAAILAANALSSYTIDAATSQVFSQIETKGDVAYQFNVKKGVTVEVSAISFTGVGTESPELTIKNTAAAGETDGKLKADTIEVEGATDTRLTLSDIAVDSDGFSVKDDGRLTLDAGSVLNLAPLGAGGIVARDGDGHLVVKNNSTLTAPASAGFLAGTLTVGESFVGVAADGLMTIELGGRVALQAVAIGDNSLLGGATARGTVLVKKTGSLESEELKVGIGNLAEGTIMVNGGIANALDATFGLDGVGTLDVKSGGLFEVLDDLILAASSGTNIGHATASVSGKSADGLTNSEINAEFIKVGGRNAADRTGSSHEAALWVTTDGVVNSDALSIGLGTTVTFSPIVSVSGPNASLNTVDFNIEEGRLEIGAGGTISSGVSNIGMTDRKVTAYVTVSGINATWTAGPIVLGKAGAKNGTATVEVSDGGIIEGSTITDVDSTLKGNSTIRGNQIIEMKGKKAKVKPGTDTDTTATLTFDTPILNAVDGMTLFADLDGTAAGEYDVLHVTGNADLGGELAVSLLGYVPDLGDEFDVMTVLGALNGEFGSYSLPDLPLGPGGEELTWDVQYDRSDDDGDGHNEVRLVVIQGGKPIAEGDQYFVLHDQSLDTFNQFLPSVLDNDYDPNGDPLTAHLVDDPLNGSVALNPDGHFVYTPNAGFAGTDYFTYYANDGYEDSYTATVTIDVTNTPPTAGDESYFIDHDTTLNESAPGVLGNDWDDDGDPLTAVLIDDVDNGSLTLNADGSFSYTPAAGFVGFASFTYAADDGFEQTLATVTIDVFNDVPLAGDDWYSVEMDTSWNEPGPGVMYNDFDMDPLTAILVDDVTSGSLALGADGGFTYTPDPGFVGVDTFTYYVTDGIANSNTATVTIDVFDMAGEGGSLVAVDDFYFTTIDTPLNEPATRLRLRLEREASVRSAPLRKVVGSRLNPHDLFIAV